MAISVYLNQSGELVIRQEGQFHPSEDVWVVIAPHNVPAVIAAMEETIGLSAAPRTGTKDPTAAQRQRRRRDRQRDNGGGPGVVTPATVTCGGPNRDGGGTNGTFPLAAE
jgi:hypothetical protein